MNSRLQAARLQAGKTQAQLAKEIGSMTQVYQRYESGKRQPSVWTAIQIAKALGCTVEELFVKKGGEEAQEID